jgi:pullulanase/glycogen debranching enzyme
MSATEVPRRPIIDTLTTTWHVRPGEPFPLGATWDGQGTNFSIFSEVAERVELCLFDRNGHETCVNLPERTAFCLLLPRQLLQKKKENNEASSN